MSDTGYGDFEFERKFFVRELPVDVLRGDVPDLIVQSYFLAAEGYALRIRLQGPARVPLERGVVDDLTVLAQNADRFTFSALTAKGPAVGGTRYEAERDLDVAVGREMVRLGGSRVVKYRHSVWLGGDGWVIDEFLGANGPLIVAECERGGPVTDLVIPDFCESELTDDPRFANESLSRRPYSGWAEQYEEELRTRGPRWLTDFGTNERA